MFPFSNCKFSFQRTPRDDERPIRQLRGPKNDRRQRTDTAQGADAQDQTTPELAEEIHIRQTHNCQAGEVLYEGSRLIGLHRRGAGPDRPAHQWRPLILINHVSFKSCLLI